MKIVTVIGARPQFIKAAPISKAIRAYPKLNEIIVHTGQHFDANMSQVFFEQLDIPKPSFYLNINGGTHGDMTGKMLAGIEQVLLDIKPDILMVYGDTNSTLAGALAAVKLHIPVAHIEAGLRSFNPRMPEEINRVLTDHISTHLFCPTETAMNNLKQEGLDLKEGVRILKSGDVMKDAVSLFSTVDVSINDLIPKQKYILATIHREENTNNLERLRSIVEALNDLHTTFAPVVLPIHPRTRKILQSSNISLKMKVIEPIGYIEMLNMIKLAGIVITDSGGIQKEAYMLGTPCLTTRDETEWIELVEQNVNKLVGADRKLIIAVAQEWFGKTLTESKSLYGDGDASLKIVTHLTSYGTWQGIS